jgi:hypothetical protein
MQSGEALAGDEAERSAAAWLRARDAAVREARALAELGVHKEYANRLLEPFLWHTVVVTATEWANYFALRCHPAASEPIRLTSELMRDALASSEPTPLRYSDWHLPYVGLDELLDFAPGSEKPVQVSAARCARVSYLTHDGRRSHEADLELYGRLASLGHMAPLEHPARPATADDVGRGMVPGGLADPEPQDAWFGNFRGWVQHRKEIPGEAVFTAGAS